MPKQSIRWAAFCLLIAGVLSAGNLPAASAWFARSWQVEDGLPGDNVTGIAQTQDGFLWIATQSGLARFDGIRITPVPIPIGRRYPIIRAMLLDREQSLWLAEEGGALVRFLHDGPMLLNESNGLSRAQATDIAQAPDGAIWISYIDGTVCRVVDGKVVSCGEDRGFPAGGACTFSSGADGPLWFAKAGKLGIINGDRGELVRSFQERNVQVETGRNGTVWLCVGEKILRFEKATSSIQEIGRIPAETTAARAAEIFEDKTGALWLGTLASGLFRLDGTNLNKIETSHGRIHAITEDREGNVWVGTDGGGLNRLRPQIVELQGKDAGLPFETVRSVCQDHDGMIWAITQNGEVARHDDEGWTTISAAGIWPGGQATCVLCDKQGAVCIGTYSHGLYLFKNGKFEVLSRRSGLASTSIRALLCDSRGDLWIAFSAVNALQRYSQGHFTRYSLPEGSRAVRAICEDARGNIWLANLDAQLLRVQDSNIVDVTRQTLETNRPIRCLLGTRDGSIWIGYSSAGLGRLRDGKFALIGRDQGLKDANICSMVLDDCDWMWFGADHGVFRTRLQDLQDLSSGALTQLRAISYGRDEGLPSVQGYYGYAPGASKGRDGTIFIPTHSGVVIAHPERIQTNLAIPPVIIERVAVDDREIANDISTSLRTGGQRTEGRATPDGARREMKSGTSGFVLEPGHKKMEFSFTAPSFIEPRAITFRYKLEGWDDAWQEAREQRLAIYPHLPAGDYRFRVQAMNADGIRNEAGASVAFRVKPFFWQTWTFRICCGVLLCASIFAVSRFVILRRVSAQLRRLEQENALQRERARIAQDIHDDLGARMTQISLLADRTQRALKQPERAGEHVSQIAAMSREGIRSLDEIVWAVNPRNDTLPDLLDYAGQYAVDFLSAADIRCRLDFPGSPPNHKVSAETRHGLFLALKEALHNVAKHSGASEVHLRAVVNGSGVEWIIEDNGRGFPDGPQAAFADGLGNMRRRLEGLGGTCIVDAKSGQGTRIRFEMPIST